MRSAIFAAVSLFAAIRLSNTQTIDPDSVPLSEREQWCQSQEEQCPLICLQFTSDNPQHNDCDPDTLAYNCVCSNGMTPNASEYSQTIPYFECTEFANQCVEACGQDNICSNNCRVDNPCGAQNPKRVNATSTSASASASATGTASGSSDSAAATTDYSAFGAESSGAAVSNVRINAISFGSTYGLVVVLGGLFAGAALIL